MAGRARAGARRVRDGRRRHPPDRVPRRGDRRGRAADRAGSVGLGGDPATDERSRGERDRRGELPSRRSATSAVSRARAGSSATSGWIRVSAGPGPARRPTVTSPSKARSGRATRWWRRGGRRSASPGRCCTRCTSVSARAAGTPSRSSPPPGKLVLVSARARAGPRLRPAVADAQKLRPRQITAGAPRHTAEAPPASGTPTTRSARPSASSPARPRPPTSQRCATGMPRRRTRRARARHRDAHPQAVRAASSAAGRRSQTLRSSSSSPAPTPNARSAQTVQRP